MRLLRKFTIRTFQSGATKAIQTKAWVCFNCDPLKFYIYGQIGG